MTSELLRLSVEIHVRHDENHGLAPIQFNSVQFITTGMWFYFGVVLQRSYHNISILKADNGKKENIAIYISFLPSSSCLENI